MTIYVPNLDFIGAFQLIDEINAIDENIEDKKITFDFSRMTNFDPFAMLVSSVSIRNLKNKFEDLNITCTNYENHSYASTMGFFDNCGFDDNRYIFAKGNQNYLPIRKISFDDIHNKNEVIQDSIEKYAEKLASVFSRDNQNMKDSIKFIITEIIRNVKEHSESKYVWIAAQHWPNHKLVEFAILDEGIGIQQSLKKNYRYKENIKDDIDAIKLALLPGVSCVRNLNSYDYDYWANSGFGLYVASKLCREMKGSFLIASGNDAVLLREKNKRHKSTLINGTAVKMTINTSMINNYESILQTIVDNGNQLAKKINSEYKQASKASSNNR